MRSLRRDWWLFAVLFSFGCLAFIGLAAAARRCPQRSDLRVATVVSAVASASAVAVALLEGASDGAAAAIAGSIWLAAIPYALAVYFSAEYRANPGQPLLRRSMWRRFRGIGMQDPRLERTGGISRLATLAGLTIGATIVAVGVFVAGLVAVRGESLWTAAGAMLATGLPGAGLCYLNWHWGRIGVYIDDRAVTLRYWRRVERVPLEDVVAFERVGTSHALLRRANGVSLPLPGVDLYATPISSAGVEEAVAVLNHKLVAAKRGSAKNHADASVRG